MGIFVRVDSLEVLLTLLEFEFFYLRLVCVDSSSDFSDSVYSLSISASDVDDDTGVPHVEVGIKGTFFLVYGWING